MSKPLNPMRRRELLQAAGGLALAGAAPLALAQDKKIVVSDPGGPYTAAYRRAFYDPFEKATGIKVINVAREMIGLQLGVVNVIQNKDVAFLPILNCYF